MRLQDIINAGGQCVWSGVQRRPLVPLTGATCQGTGGRPAADVLCDVTRKEGPEGVRGLRYVPINVARPMRVGRARCP